MRRRMRRLRWLPLIMNGARAPGVRRIYFMLPFWKIIPGGNPTLLFRSSDVPEPMRVDLADAAMSPMHIGAEQVGFIDAENCRLDMMGGEFCVNASRAFSLLLAKCGKLRDGPGHCMEGDIHVSGCERPLNVRVRKQNKDIWRSDICLGFSSFPTPVPLKDGSFLIKLPGIAHVIEICALPENIPDFCRTQRERNGLGDFEAVGHIWIESIQTANPCAMQKNPSLRITPIVWVRATDTLCRETACGSGTLAAAIYLMQRSSGRIFRMEQPSGSILDVRFHNSHNGWDAWVGGPAWEAAQGMTNLDVRLGCRGAI